MLLRYILHPITDRHWKQFPLFTDPNCIVRSIRFEPLIPSYGAISMIYITIFTTNTDRLHEYINIIPCHDVELIHE